MQTLSKKLAKYFPAHQNITLIANGLGLIEIFLVSIPKANSKFHSNSKVNFASFTALGQENLKIDVAMVSIS